MLASGLLWFDDDSRRPVAVKVADAVARYRERLSHEPTVCYVNPSQAALPATPKASRDATPPVRLVPDASVRPNYFLVADEERDATAPPDESSAGSLSDEAATRPATTATRSDARTARPRRRRATSSDGAAARVPREKPAAKPVAPATSPAATRGVRRVAAQPSLFPPQEDILVPQNAPRPRAISAHRGTPDAQAATRRGVRRAS